MRQPRWHSVVHRMRWHLIGLGIIAIVIVGGGIVAVMARSPAANGGSTSPNQSSTASSIPTNVKWVTYTDPSGTGFKWALAVIKVSVATKPASASALAIPRGKANLTVEVAVKNLTNGSVLVPMSWDLGLSESVDDNCKSEINEPTMGGPTYYAVPGHANYCWEPSNYYDGSNENALTLATGQLATGNVIYDAASYDGKTTQLNTPLAASDVVVGYGNPNGKTVLTLPQP